MVTLLAAGVLTCGPQDVASTYEADNTLQTAASAAPHVAKPIRVTVPQGTEVPVVLSTNIGSGSSQVGEAVTARTLEPVVIGGQVAIPAGSAVHGLVTEVSSGTKGLDISEKGGVISLNFDQVTTPQGVSTPVSASITSIARSAGKTAGIIGGSAAGGALLGKILGGSTKDAALGAVVGGGIGTAIAAGTKGKELVIPAGTHLTLVLDQAVTMVEKS